MAQRQHSGQKSLERDASHEFAGHRTPDAPSAPSAPSAPDGYRTPEAPEAHDVPHPFGTHEAYDDRLLRQRLLDGEAAVLGELYDRFASLVHGLAHRVLADDDADRVTCDVFTHLWEHPEDYEPARGPLRSWLAESTHRLAVRRLRDIDDRAPGDGAHGAGTGSGGGAREVERTVREASAAARADYLVTSMPAPLRAALDLAYFQRLDCRQVAADLGISEAETHHRLRIGLRALATAHVTGSANPPPLGYGETRSPMPWTPATTPSVASSTASAPSQPPRPAQPSPSSGFRRTR